jgi:hypothetical protein
VLAMSEFGRQGAVYAALGWSPAFRMFPVSTRLGGVRKFAPCLRRF